MCSVGCVFPVLRPEKNLLPMWLTSCSTCCGHIRQTDHINCIDSTARWQLLEKTSHLISFGVYHQPNTHIHVHPSCWLFWSLLLFLEGRWVIQPSSMYVYFCIWLLRSFLCPFYSAFICPPEGRGLTTGWGSMNCCVVLSQRRILFRRPPGG